MSSARHKYLSKRAPRSARNGPRDWGTMMPFAILLLGSMACGPFAVCLAIRHGAARIESMGIGRGSPWSLETINFGASLFVCFSSWQLKCAIGAIRASQSPGLVLICKLHARCSSSNSSFVSHSEVNNPFRVSINLHKNILIASNSMRFDFFALINAMSCRRRPEPRIFQAHTERNTGDVSKSTNKKSQNDQACIFNKFKQDNDNDNDVSSLNI